MTRATILHGYTLSMLFVSGARVLIGAILCGRPPVPRAAQSQETIAIPRDYHMTSTEAPAQHRCGAPALAPAAS
eukprot:8734626-Pyramimonas_sp.AAC.1